MLTTKIIPGRFDNIPLAVATLAAITAAVLVANGAMGARAGRGSCSED